VVARLSQAIREITEMPEVQSGWRRWARTRFPQQRRIPRALASDHQKFGAIIRAAGIEPN